MSHVQLNLANLVKGTGHGHKFRKRKPRNLRAALRDYGLRRP